MSAALPGAMRALPLVLLLACKHSPPADAGAAPVAETDAPAAASDVPAELAWVDEVFPLLQAGDWVAVLVKLDAVIAREDLGPAGQAMARWYRAAARASVGDRAGEIEDLRAFVTAASQLPTERGGRSGAELRHRIAKAQLAILAEEAASDPRIGASTELAVPVMLASDEYFFLGRLSCGPGLAGGYEVLEQALVQDQTGVYDHLSVRCNADGAARDVWFDIGEWWALLGYGLQGGEPPAGLDEEGARYLLEAGLR